MAIDCEISMSGSCAACHIDLRLTPPGNNLPSLLVSNIAASFEPADLRALVLDGVAYGELLSSQLFAEAALREAWAQAIGIAQGRGDSLRVRLRIDSEATDLHDLIWESLIDPLSGSPLALDQRILFSRYLDTQQLAPVVTPLRPRLKALLVIANPSNLVRYGLTPLWPELEITPIVKALQGITTTVLGIGDDPASRHATINGIIRALGAEIHIFYLICHGKMVNGQPYLWLEDEAGCATPVSGKEVARLLTHLKSPPTLVILATCQGAGLDTDQVITAIGPLLARGGIPAVIGMRGMISLQAVHELMPFFFRELVRDGMIDQALSRARPALQRDEWWKPVLWLRVATGLLWGTPVEDSLIPQLIALCTISGREIFAFAFGDAWRMRLTQVHAGMLLMAMARQKASPLAIFLLETQIDPHYFRGQLRSLLHIRRSAWRSGVNVVHEGNRIIDTIVAGESSEPLTLAPSLADMFTRSLAQNDVQQFGHAELLRAILTLEHDPAVDLLFANAIARGLSKDYIRGRLDALILREFCLNRTPLLSSLGEDVA